jgi:hypothetical protein
MEIKRTVEITPALKKFLNNPGVVMGDARRSGMINLVEEIEARAKKEVPIRISNLLKSISTNVSIDGTKGEIVAGAPYAEFVHRGTGPYGPYKQRIRPTTKKALFWPGALHQVKSTKGQKPNPFFDRALSKIDLQAKFGEGIFNYLKKIGVA